MIGAGIVSYNPEIDRLSKNINGIVDQVDVLYIVDNSSKNVDEVERLTKRNNKIVLIKNTENKGIATALNQICEKAENDNISWCILLDQDSVVSPNIISEYNKHTNDDKVGMLCPYIVDEYKISLSEYNHMRIPETSVCAYAITSGSFVYIPIWKAIGGFPDFFFIDGVDADYSYNLRAHGFIIERINSCYIMHQQGNHTEKTHIYRIHKDESGNKKWMPAFRFNYSFKRWYYMARNNLILIKKYKNMNGVVKPFISYWVRFLSVILIERNKSKVIRSINQGFRDGMKYKVEAVNVVK